MARLVLASASPRRRALLTQLGLEFEAVATPVDETPPPRVAPAAAVAAIAARKLEAYLGRPDARRHAHVLAADTEVVVGRKLFGKPADLRSAKTMLAALAGRTHTVVSAVVVAAPAGRRFRAVEKSRVALARLGPDQIRSYVATGEPFGKAGGYAVQGQGAALIRRVQGDYTNVVGLPIRATLRLLDRSGYPLPRHLRPS